MSLYALIFSKIEFLIFLIGGMHNWEDKKYHLNYEGIIIYYTKFNCDILFGELKHE